MSDGIDFVPSNSKDGIDFRPSGQSQPSTIMNQVSSYVSKPYQGDLSINPENAVKALNFMSPPGVSTKPLEAASSIKTPEDFVNAVNIPGEFEHKRQVLEGVGQRGRESINKSVGNTVSDVSALASKYLPKYLAEPVRMLTAIGGGITSSEAQIAPITPTETGTVAAGNMLPSAISGAIPKSMLESVANRWANAPKWLREGRLEKGQPTVGADVLDLPKEKVGDLAISNKKEAWNAAKLADTNLGSQVKNKIQELLKSSQAEPIGISVTNPDLTSSVRPSAYQVPKQEIADSIDKFASTLDEPDRLALMKYKDGWLAGKPDVLNPLEQNMERVKLGGELGKDFAKTSPELANKAEAQKIMWQYLRNKIGTLSPELDELLQLQHRVIDVKNSIKPEAALGYTKTPMGWWDAAKAPLERNIGLADYLNQAKSGLKSPEVGTLGAVTASGVRPLSDELNRR